LHFSFSRLLSFSLKNGILFQTMLSSFLPPSAGVTRDYIWSFPAAWGCGRALGARPEPVTRRGMFWLPSKHTNIVSFQ